MNFSLCPPPLMINDKYIIPCCVSADVGLSAASCDALVSCGIV